MALNYFDKEKLRNLVGVLGGRCQCGARRLERILFREGDMDLSKISELREFGPEEEWGGFDKTGWFRLPVTIPQEMDGKSVWIEFNDGRPGWDATNPQYLVYVNGKETQALDVNHTQLLLCEKAKAGDTYLVDLDAWSGMVIRGASWFDNENSPVKLKTKLFWLDEPVYKLYYDLKVPLDVACSLTEEDYRREMILRHLWHAMNLLDLRDLSSPAFSDSVKIAADYLEKEFYQKVCGHYEAEAYCVGHTHIDVAWLWTYAHTRKKSVRSFSTALELMEEYPEYVFMSSQPQLYQFVKQDHPEVYARIKEKIAQGQWDPEGGMWVEADCNLSSGESLIRQFIHGKRFFQEELGTDSKVLWLPDVFGYSAALPQICKKCGIDYFMTTKISWNEMNQIPYDTFYWKGIDGTKILTHFIPTKGRDLEHKDRFFTTYNGYLDANNIMGAWDRYQQKHLNNYYMVSYGYGDGGGGTTRDMVENSRRLSRGIPGCPIVRQTKVLDFFQKLEGDLAGKARVPEWFGELYLEYHRGTYTSMAKNKRNNRKSEFALERAETLSAMAETLTGKSLYPAQRLSKNWETVLLNQFHDVLPGSSIQAVYEDTDVLYANLLKDADEMIRDAKEQTALLIKRSGDALVVFNTLGFARDSVVEFSLPASQIPSSEDFHLWDLEAEKSCPVQKTWEGTYVFLAENLPGSGYRTYAIRSGKAEGTAVTVEGRTFSNNLLEVSFDDQGNISSIFDKEAGRQVLSAGQKANVLETYEDRPHNYEAWDINVYYKDKMWTVDELASFTVLENGPVRTVVRLVRPYLRSVITQDIVFYSHSKRIDFVSTVDWKQQQILLKTAFPVDILSTRATYEIQYGSVERPTHTNTEWDFARFETCAQKWADLSEEGYGVAILNDCKYGHDIHDGVIRLTLVKSAVNPNPAADKEIHHFTYSLVPHCGDWREADIPREAYDLNVPAESIAVSGTGGELSPSFSLFSVDCPNVNMEVLKKAESGKDWVIRCYEAFGGRAEAHFQSAFGNSQIYECDMLENCLQKIPAENGSFTASFKPYEIKTFRVAIQ